MSLRHVDRDKIKEIEEGILLGETPDETKLIRNGLRTGRVISEAVCMARDLVNGPSNKVTPSLLAEKAGKISKEHGMELQVLEVGQAEAMGMGAAIIIACYNSVYVLLPPSPCPLPDHQPGAPSHARLNLPCLFQQGERVAFITRSVDKIPCHADCL